MIYALYIIVALVLLFAFTIIIALLRPSDFRITRSLQIDATPEQLFPFINSLKKFQEWNPFKDKDPQALNEFSGAEQGPGSVFHWSGNSSAGEGIMTILSTVPQSTVNVDLEFIKPFPGHNAVEFSLAPQARGTLVTWSMAGKYALVPKIVGQFINMDKMIGNEFDKGLLRLKSLMETERQ